MKGLKNIISIVGVLVKYAGVAMAIIKGVNVIKEELEELEKKESKNAKA